MDSDRFDRWTKLFARRLSRRTAVAGFGMAAVASLGAPRWALAQDDDQDQDDDIEQHKDNPTGEDSDDNGQTDDDGGDDATDGDDESDNTTDDDDQSDGGDDNADEDVGFEVCSDITRCKMYFCSPAPGPEGEVTCQYRDVGPIPGGPYPQAWAARIPPCQPTGHTIDELGAICNAAYPEKNCFECCSDDSYGNNICQACTDYALAFCH